MERGGLVAEVGQYRPLTMEWSSETALAEDGEVVAESDVVQHWKEWSKACLQQGYFRLERMGVNGES